MKSVMIILLSKLKNTTRKHNDWTLLFEVMVILTIVAIFIIPNVQTLSYSNYDGYTVAYFNYTPMQEGNGVSYVPITSVTAYFTVPELSYPSDVSPFELAGIALWTGLINATLSTTHSPILQCGIENHPLGNSNSFYAFYENLPQNQSVGLGTPIPALATVRITTTLINNTSVQYQVYDISNGRMYLNVSVYQHILTSTSSTGAEAIIEIPAQSFHNIPLNDNLESFGPSIVVSNFSATVTGVGICNITTFFHNEDFIQSIVQDNEHNPEINNNYSQKGTLNATYIRSD